MRSASRVFVDDFERRLVARRPAAHVVGGGRHQHDVPADHVTLEQAQEAVLGQRRRPQRRRRGHLLAQGLE